MPYIKSHSNYILKKRHQSVNDGTIYERDITTIGGRDNFSPDQTPLYKDGNFVITINNDDNVEQSFLSDAWEKNPWGEVWTLNSLSGLSSTTIAESSDSSIALKRDYYDLRDFAYFGSCSELIRASINDILKNFPGELYFAGSGNTVFWTNTKEFTKAGNDTLNDTNDNDDAVSDSKTQILALGGDNYTLVDNPFGIDAYSSDDGVLNNEKPLSEFKNNGYLNYEIIDNKGKGHQIASWSAVTAGKYCIGEKYRDITVTSSDGISLSFGAWIGNEYKVYYLTNDAQYTGYRIRPKENWIEKFFKNLDSFEKILLNRDSTPKYTAVFNITRENENGYYTNLEYFTFPTTYGDYNIGSSGPAFDDYLGRLVDIADFYDEHFSDNMYRSLTHESIKNFDWTYGKDKTDDEKEDIENSGNKVSSVIRLWGREFDEILSYIDAISNYNVITYNNVNNLPDFFFSDALENKGWDLKQIIPLELSEYTGDNKYNTVSGLSANEEQSNITDDGEKIHRVFNQTKTLKIKPYHSNDNGYFYGCFCNDNGEKNRYILSGNDDTRLDCTDVLRFRIKNYSSDKEWNMNEVNTEFMKRLILNSEYIWRHKGTQEGIEMVLAMFGMKSKRWYDGLTVSNKNTYNKSYSKTDDYKPYDFEITEYTSFTKRIEDTYIDSINDFKYDWVNKNKLISYNDDDVYSSYQGLPVTYRTSDNGKIRYLYPDFQKDSTYDGNPYYQMNGGWLSTLPYMFDKDDNLVVKKDDSEIYHETLRNVESVNTLQDLFNIPSQNLENGDICHVTNLSGRYAVVDGKVYNILTESDGQSGFSYIEETVDNGILYIGNAYFSDYAIISDPFYPNQKRRYDFSDGSYNGQRIKIYLIKDSNHTTDIIYAYSNDQSVSTFTIFQNGKYMEGSGFTQYFRINDVSYSNELSIVGWEQLKDTDYDYYKINSNKNYYDGNNPHTGRLHYDNGHEYFTYFSKLFKFASNNDLFNNAALTDYPNFENYNLYDDIDDFGFKNLISSDECRLDYDDLITPDSKVHYFGDFHDVFGNDYTYDDAQENSKNGKNKSFTYNLSAVNPEEITAALDETSNGYGKVTKPCNDDDASSTDGTPIDGITNQIVNNKLIKIVFYLRDNNFYTHSGLEEMKYIQSIVISYMTQMIPSGAILGTEYRYKGQIISNYTIKVTIDGNGADNVPICTTDGEIGYTNNGTLMYQTEGKNK